MAFDPSGDSHQLNDDAVAMVSGALPATKLSEPIVVPSSLVFENTTDALDVVVTVVLGPLAGVRWMGGRQAKNVAAAPVSGIVIGAALPVTDRLTTCGPVGAVTLHTSFNASGDHVGLLIVP
jgi:hypothetical protein